MVVRPKAVAVAEKATWCVVMKGCGSWLVRRVDRASLCRCRCLAPSSRPSCFLLCLRLRAVGLVEEACFSVCCLFEKCFAACRWYGMGGWRVRRNVLVRRWLVRFPCRLGSVRRCGCSLGFFVHCSSSSCRLLCCHHVWGSGCGRLCSSLSPGRVSVDRWLFAVLLMLWRRMADLFARVCVGRAGSQQWD